MVGVSEPAPGDEISTRGDDRCWIQLQERQPRDERAQVAWPLGVKKLRADGDATRLLAREEAHLVAGSLGVRFATGGVKVYE